MTWPAHQFHPGQLIQFEDEFPVPVGYRAPAVTFDGTNDYLARGGGLTSVVDSKMWTGSIWSKAGADGTAMMLVTSTTTLGGTTSRSRLVRSSTNRFQVIGVNVASATTILDIRSGANLTAAGGWQHCMFSVNMADAGQRHLYRNDVSDLGVTTYTDDTIDFTWADWGIGGEPGNSELFTGDMADVLMWPGVYVDLSQQANRRLFIDAFGKPVNPAAAIASLGTPAIALYAPEPNWHVNQGSGGGFTENGALSDAASSPSD